MNELQNLMGDAYKEGMSIDDIGKFFENKKFVDLSTGNYVDKAKFDKQVNSLSDQLKEKENELNAKLTDEEKNAKTSIEQQKRIEELEQKLKENTISGNKNVVNSVLQGSRDILGIQSTDNDFVSFVDNITTEDADKTNKIANYVSKLINDSYEKGKQDATKDAMGNFGSGKSQNGNDSNKAIGKLGEELAKLNNEQPSFDYFK